MVKKSISGTEQEQHEIALAIEKKVSDSINNVDSYSKALKEIKVEILCDPLKDIDQPVKRIHTHTALDRILGRNGGLEAGRTVLFWGYPATGKTEVCMALAAETEGLIVVIDGEDTFTPKRFKEICLARGKNIADVSSRLMLIKPNSWQQQEAAIDNLPEFDKDGKLYDVGIVILDSLMNFWASDPQFQGRDKMTRRQQLIRNELAKLKRYARRHNGVFIFTEQVYEKPIDTSFLPLEEKISPRGGPTVKHFPDYNIMIRKGFGNMRFARLVDAIDLPLLEVPFVLEASGIMDIPDPAERAKAVVASNSYATKFLSGQAGSKPAGKEYKLEALKLGYITKEEALALGVTETEANKSLDEQTKTMDERLGELSEDERAVLDTSEEPTGGEVVESEQ